MIRKSNWYFFLGGLGICQYFSSKVNSKKDYKVERSNAYIDILNRWLTLRDQQVFISKYLEEKGYRKVAIYGLGMFGNHLYEELRQTRIEIVGIDQAEIYNNFKMQIYKPFEIFEGVELIIVTPFEYKNICENLRKTYRGEILSLQQILTECENYLY